MFVLGFLLLGPFSTSPANAGIPSICEGRKFGACVQWVLLARCGSYGKWNPFRGHEVLCESAVVEMMKQVEAFQPKDENGITEETVVAFRSRLSALLAQRKTFYYLQELPKAADSAMQEGVPFRLWEYTLAHTRGDESQALELLAILFQDTFTNPEPIVLEYAQAGSRSLTERERDAWRAAIEAVSIERLSDISEPAAVWVRPYPEIDASSLNKGFYHFYFAAHIARKLRETKLIGKGLTESGMAGFAPFLLNLVYETAELDPQVSPLRDPPPFSTSKRYKLADIYAGYLGALFGLGGEMLVAKAMPFDTFSARLASDPRAMTQALYENFLPAKPKPSP